MWYQMLHRYIPSVSHSDSSLNIFISGFDLAPTFDMDRIRPHPQGSGNGGARGCNLVGIFVFRKEIDNWR
ncbi:uncharacterized protein YALI1_E15421g [Yarrowia lipolytica]|uniref:Uncharacterized protein n=1 Tax=Yarrowia lipolytica TaxID=4952 RepID=A0A1D8NI91_YARLL|nr:hypothetical protein YALI1_E15421g [Yarrowia lipolytica]